MQYYQTSLKHDCLIQVTVDHPVALMHYYANIQMALAMLGPPVSQIRSVYKVALCCESCRTCGREHMCLSMNTQMPRGICPATIFCSGSNSESYTVIRAGRLDLRYPSQDYIHQQYSIDRKVRQLSHLFLYGKVSEFF